MLACVALSLCAAPAARAQTPFTSVGLGYPLQPVDARAAALGGTGLGLLGGTFSLVNPADMTQFFRPALSLSFSPERFTVKSDAGDQTNGRTRFPVLAAIVPLGDWAFSFGFGGSFDQDFSFQIQDTLSTSIGNFEFEEIRDHNGGVSTIDFSLARRIGPLSIGGAVQRLTGSLQQTLRRTFTDTDSIGLRPNPVLDQSEAEYGGWAFKAGGNLNIADRVLLSGVATFATDLDSKTLEITTGELETPVEDGEVTFQLPTVIQLGASGWLTPRLLLAVTAGFAGWSESDSAAVRAVTNDVSWFGGGLEYTARLGALPLPLRVGGRTGDLPFSLAGFEQAKEQALTVGLGTRLGGRAAFDLGVEIGKRGDLAETGLQENFARFTLTASISQ